MSSSSSSSPLSRGGTFPLVGFTDLSPDTRLLRFALHSPTDTCNLACVTSIKLMFVDAKGGWVARPYSPVSRCNQAGYFEIMLKKYPDGKMGNHVFNMKPGDTITVTSAKRKYPFQPNMYSSIGLIAGGSGLATCFQIIHELLETPEDKTHITLIYQNRTEEDILLKPRLDEFAAKYPDRFQVHYVLSRPRKPEEFTGDVGYVNAAMIDKYMPPEVKTEHGVMGVVGPDGLVRDLVGRHRQGRGHHGHHHGHGHHGHGHHGHGHGHHGHGHHGHGHGHGHDHGHRHGGRGVDETEESSPEDKGALELLGYDRSRVFKF